MSSQTSKQLVMGIVLGLAVSGIIWFLLGSKRSELEELKASNESLEQEVTKGRQLKASYEKLKKEVDEQVERINELIKLFPSENERTRITQMVQKLANNAGLGQMQMGQNVPKPNKTEYYSEWETNYKYNGGFHEYGEFLSLISGFDKIINISDITMVRNATRSSYPASISFRLSVFVYDGSLETVKKPATPGKSSSSGD